MPVPAGWEVFLLELQRLELQVQALHGVLLSLSSLRGSRVMACAMRNTLIVTLLFCLFLPGCESSNSEDSDSSTPTLPLAEIQDREAVLMDTLAAPITPSEDEVCEIWVYRDPSGKVDSCGYKCPGGTFGICWANSATGGFGCVGDCQNANATYGKPICGNNYNSPDCPWVP